MELIEVTADERAGIVELTRIYEAARRVDSPWELPWTPRWVEAEVRHGWDGEPGRHFLAAVGGRAVGLAVVHTTEYDNPDLASVEVVVDPDARRRGHGSAVLEEALGVCLSMQRTNITAESWLDEGFEAFATAHGFRRASVSARRRHDVDTQPPGLVDALYLEARAEAEDYELLRVHGRTPDDLVERLAVATAAINDAPLDDLDVEDDQFPPERIRAYEEAQLARGPGFYRVLALHRSSGEVAGHTVVAVDPERPAYGEQHDTAVVAAHRGHRLGVLLKSDMVRWLREVEPQLQHIGTWNAASNAHMIGVNERLGYHLLGESVAFQRRLGTPRVVG
jgi:GNAT superfamily N-acetyltransferase